LIEPPADEEHTPPHLRDAVLSGEQFGALDVVTGLPKCVADVSEDTARSQCGKASDVLDDEALGFQLFSYADEFPKKTISWIPNLALTNDAKALARRSADEEVQLTSTEASRSKDVRTLDVLDGHPLERNGGQVPLVRSLARFIQVGAVNHIESRIDEAERDAAGTREEVYCGRE
jgi:hypothetical protein